MFCLKPKITEVPKGDWFCPRCRPEEYYKRPKKRRAVVIEESEEEESFHEKTEKERNTVNDSM